MWVVSRQVDALHLADMNFLDLRREFEKRNAVRRAACSDQHSEVSFLLMPNVIPGEEKPECLNCTNLNHKCGYPPEVGAALESGRKHISKI